jgi:hypothetical protein
MHERRTARPRAVRNLHVEHSKDFGGWLGFEWRREEVVGIGRVGRWQSTGVVRAIQGGAGSPKRWFRACLFQFPMSFGAVEAES